MQKKWNFLSFAMGADLFGSYRITKHFGFYGNQHVLTKRLSKEVFASRTALFFEN